MATLILVKILKKLGMLCLMSSLMFFSTYAQELDWVKRVGAVGEDIAYSIAVDSSGNVYTTGTFKGLVNFNESGTPVELTSSGSNADVFITKMNSSGNLLWARRIGNTSAELGLDLAVDRDGSVYVAGRFAGTVDFDPGVGTANLVSSSHDAFVLKLDSNGVYVWAKKMGGTGWDVANAVAVDSEKNVFVTGRFDGTANFNTNTAGSPIELTASGQDIFVAKLDQNGNTLWAKGYGSTSDDWGQGIAVDANGAAYVTGFFRQTVQFGSSSNNSISSVNNTRDVFLLKLSNTGTEQWVKAIGGSSDDRGEKVTMDFEGNILLTGRIAGTDIAFGPNITLSPGSTFDAFVAKLSPDGNYTWAKNIGGSGNDYGLGIDSDSEGSVYVTGNFTGTTDLNPGLCDLEFISAGEADIHIVKLDADGQFVWGRQLGGSGSDCGNAIAVDLNQNIYTAGYFSGTADFNANLGSYLVSSSGDKDVFVHKLAVLPVPQQESVLLLSDVVNFSGYVDGDYNKLKWQLNSVDKSKSFELEKSTDFNGFKTISKIEEVRDLEFSYSDKTLDKHSFYRIKQINANGAWAYTNVILLAREDLNLVDYRVYPNPIITDNLRLMAPGDGTFTEITVNIYSISGEKIYHSQGVPSNEISIAASSWPAGVYIVEILKKSGKQYFKIVKP